MNDMLMVCENFSKFIFFVKEVENDIVMVYMYMDMVNIYLIIQLNYKKVMDYYNKLVEMLKQIKDLVNFVKVYFNIVFIVFEVGEYNEGYVYLLRVRKLEKFELYVFYGVVFDNLMGEYYYSKEKYEFV